MNIQAIEFLINVANGSAAIGFVLLGIELIRSLRC